MAIKDNFKKGSLELIVLTILQERDMYGYEIGQLIQERSKEILIIPEGSLYPAIYRLEEMGNITGRHELVGRRRMRVYYHLEPSGRERLKFLREEYESTCHGIRSIFEETESRMGNRHE